MKRISALLVVLLFAFAAFAQPVEETVVPPAEEAVEPVVEMTVDPLVGWGTETRGGLDGRIIRVTNLNASGPGSFTEAIKAEGPRTVVFEVGGVIDLEKQQIKINNPYLTIAGQTAPSPGITIIRGGLTINTHDVVIQ
ncbi:MAG: hypothetical protein KBS81_11490, partial [Spirochaetales bacterium]|nr:hypothetical protein [Candidatus Physcosoma equi]